jgi:hypothetical protein
MGRNANGVLPLSRKFEDQALILKPFDGTGDAIEVAS